MYICVCKGVTDTAIREAVHRRRRPDAGFKDLPGCERAMRNMCLPRKGGAGKSTDAEEPWRNTIPHKITRSCGCEIRLRRQT